MSAVARTLGIARSNLIERAASKSGCRRPCTRTQPVENVWQYLRANWLSNRVFDTYDAIIDAACRNGCPPIDFGLIISCRHISGIKPCT